MIVQVRFIASSLVEVTQTSAAKDSHDIRQVGDQPPRCRQGVVPTRISQRALYMKRSTEVDRKLFLNNSVLGARYPKTRSPT
jgi:hypothetical protein